jgi:hypothetical protein
MNHLYKEDSGVEDRRLNGYEYSFVLFSVSIEAWLKRIILFVLSLLIMFQLLLQVPGIRYYLVKVEQLEGVPFSRSH